jgi:hypothetical protein
MEEAKRAIPPRDDRGLRLGAGLAEGGETGIAYSVFLLLPNHLEWSTAVWIAILVVTVVARTVLAYRSLRPLTEAGSGVHTDRPGSETTREFDSRKV